MKLWACAAAGLLVGILTVGQASGSTGTCTSHTAWTGTETSTQHDGATLLQIPVRQAMTVTGIDLSNAYVQRSGVNGFTEELLLAGISDGPLTVVKQLPALPPDPAFGDNVVTSDSQHNENPHVSQAVVGSQILKSWTGSANGSSHIVLNRSVQPGAVIWIYYASISGPLLDPEVQAVITYQECE